MKELIINPNYSVCLRVWLTNRKGNLLDVNSYPRNLVALENLLKA